MKTAGEHEVEVHGNIVDSTIENYESNKKSELSGKKLKQYLNQGEVQAGAQLSPSQDMAS